MTREMLPYLLIGFFSVFVSSVSQTLLKKASMKERGSILQEYLNLPVILAYGMFFGSTLLTMLAYKKLPLSMSPAFESSSYLFVTLFGVTIFKEKVGKRKLLALLLILAGILIFTLSSESWKRLCPPRRKISPSSAPMSFRIP